jgi:hypothetical protein
LSGTKQAQTIFKSKGFISKTKCSNTKGAKGLFKEIKQSSAIQCLIKVRDKRIKQITNILQQNHKMKVKLLINNYTYI